jgi:hypothetical protein
VDLVHNKKASFDYAQDDKWTWYITKRPLAWTLLCLFGLPRWLSSRIGRMSHISWEVDVGEVFPVTLPYSGLLFLLGTGRSPRDGSLTRPCGA